MSEHVLIVSFGNPVAADYATHCLRQSTRQVTIVASAELCRLVTGPANQCSKVSVAEVVKIQGNGRGAEVLQLRLPGGIERVALFLGTHWSRSDQTLLEAVRTIARAKQVRSVCIVSSFRVHFGEDALVGIEALVLRHFCDLQARVIVLRPSHVLSPHAPLSKVLRNSWYWLPFIPGQLKGCCLSSEDLFAAIDQELSKEKPAKGLIYTLLGANQTWRGRLLENNPRKRTRAFQALTNWLLPLVVIRFLAGWILGVVAGRMRRLQVWHTETLRPRSLRELLALYNPYNYRHVKIVGYNNGVIHFGQRFPGKTVVSTIRCNRRARVHDDRAEFDAGVTIRQAMDILGPHKRELPVLPNYSYVSLGTGLFIPIHGSASKLSTLAETIEKAVLYVPTHDRIVIAKKPGPQFGRFVYNLAADVLLLRLVVRTQEKSRYSVRRLEADHPSSQDILAYFHDNAPSNVEVRKAGSQATKVHVYQYFTRPIEANGTSLDLPRDALGRVWDRLEENRLSAFLFHGLTRWLAHHVELFLSESEFDTFWGTHSHVPIRKIQLRFIRRDRWPHSPFRDHDCISADLFMLKKDRGLFETYLRQTLPAVKMNPGKHSM